MANNINLNNWWVAKQQVDSIEDLEAGVEQGTVVGIDRTNMSTGATLITIASSSPSSPVDGEIWVDSAALTGAPAVRPRIWNAASSEWLGCNVLYQTTMPSTTTTGWLWYDMTLELLRMYRSATEDPQGVAGWHPVSNAYQLWVNKSGSSISANRVVVQYTATAVERGITTSVRPKHMSVIGVAMEAIANDAFGVVAIVGGGAVVDIYCNLTDGDVALGDGICNSSVAGEGRTTGLLATSPNALSAVMQMGIPAGAFAQAQAILTGSAGLVACRLLGQVGTGAIYRKATTTIAALANGLASVNWDGGWDEVDVASHPPGGGGSDFIASGKHKPILAVELCVDAAMDSNNAGSVLLTMDLSLGPDASTTFQKIHAEGENSNGDQNSMQAGGIWVPTSAGTPYTAAGNKFTWAGTKTANAGTPTVVSANFRATAYLY